MQTNKQETQQTSKPANQQTSGETVERNSPQYTREHGTHPQTGAVNMRKTMLPGGGVRISQHIPLQYTQLCYISAGELFRLIDGGPRAIQQRGWWCTVAHRCVVGIWAVCVGQCFEWVGPCQLSTKSYENRR
jgi:hypothetical protein